MDIQLTDSEKKLILRRRELMKARQARQAQPNQGLNRPAEGNSPPAPQQQPRPDMFKPHTDLSRPHRGRLQPDHPVYWFEKEIFQQIGNVQHKKEHEKIAKLLKMPVQNKFRDRVYHALCHLDVLWTEGRLPVRYKVAYEKLKKDNNIGDDNIHPGHKLEGETYPVAQNKRPWDPEKYKDYDDNEPFLHACFRDKVLDKTAW